jgi:thiamine-phosphate pyrophosphorylase
MKLIVITAPEFLADEAEAIDLLFRHGLDTLHLRKPGASEADVARLLAEIPQQWHGRIMLHDLDLTDRFHLMGLHLNGRRPMPPVGYKGRLSVACHSLQELAERKPTVDYAFLSPIYDSISKAGYRSAYTAVELEEAHRTGVIDERVVAMGGISLHNIPDVAALGFGGVALLGDVWSRVGDRESFAAHFDDLREVTQNQM